MLVFFIIVHNSSLLSSKGRESSLTRE